MQFIDTTSSSNSLVLRQQAVGGKDQESCSTIPSGRSNVGRPFVFLLTQGGTMHRFLIAMLLCLGFGALAGTEANAQTFIQVGGYLTPGNTRIFHSRDSGNSANDTIYQIQGTYSVSGTLIVQEGAEVDFLPNSRIIDSSGGRIIANGCTGLQRRILFRGLPVNSNSVEWGHFLILPGAGSAYFSNVRFTNFKKGITVDNNNALLFGPVNPGLANSLAITAQSSGVGGVFTTFSQNTYVYDAIVDSCEAMYRGGAFAFLQAPLPSFFPNDDGRIALDSLHRQVGHLVIRDTRVYNSAGEFHAPSADPNTFGGAIYMASRSNTLDQTQYVHAYLGNHAGGCYADTADQNLFERCSANNPNTGGNQLAEGGAIYVGNNTGLTATYLTCNSNSAIAANSDQNMRGGAIAVSSTSGSPLFLPPAPGLRHGIDRLPGLAILKQATFNGNVAGMGGAIFLDYNIANAFAGQPALNIDGENSIYDVNADTLIRRDSGNILLENNVAYFEGGAVYTSWFTYVTGYLAPQNFPYPGGIDSVEMRVKFYNNVAGVAGGSLFLNGQVGNADIQNRRVWHEHNSVNPMDPRVNRPSLTTSVLGGGAEYVGLRDSTFATEYHGNFTIGGNGGAVCMVDPQGGMGLNATNRYFVDEGFNASNIRSSPLPYDPRQLTRFCDNFAALGTAADSATLVATAAASGKMFGGGGALYINITNKTNPILPIDSTFFTRVRMERNTAFTGSAVYSDNYDLRLYANLCLIANNYATSGFSRRVDLVNGISNPGDPLASATLWGEFEGALPSYETNSRGNAVYDNNARYILRLPVSPVVGKSGTDTLRGNFWGDTGPNIITQINPPNGAEQSTFFLDYYRQGCYTNVYEPNRYYPALAYHPDPIGTVPDTLLMEGRVYDLFDRGTDMKVVDYNNRRLAPAEDMALGIPNDVLKLHRFTRNIFDTDPTYISKIMLMNIDFTGPHPIGFPLFLQADVAAQDSNRDNCARNYTVLFVINSTTNEFVRVNAKETVADEGANAPGQFYQGRLDFVPDSSVATRNPAGRAKVLYTLSLLRPTTLTFDEIQRASKLEDSAALDGRTYKLDSSQFRGNGADSICTEGHGLDSVTTWYAGERYHTLPVRPGDHIRVISRTNLWKYGAAGAFARGLDFVIGDVLPPAFVGDIPTLSNDSINPNRRFIHEDVNYDGSDLSHTLFRVAGYDVNNFYDPRFLFNPGNFTQLKFNVGYDVPHLGLGNATAADSAGVRLFKWLNQTTIFNANITGSNGYILLTGQPHNPDVVPGGEGLTVTVTNFVPNSASEDSLLKLSGLGSDSLNLSEFSFPPYFNCPSGFLPDSSVCLHSTSSQYRFRIYVMDSLPVFTSNPSTACAANLTDSLRYDYDVQTDDESEDSVAQTQGWDFRYGRTKYRYTIMPQWLTQSATDPNFIAYGKIHVRLDSASVYPLITPRPQINGELNLDTVIAVEANDGHTGKEQQKWKIPVNVEPHIITTSLPNAKQDVDYSFDIRDTVSGVNRILITDANYSDFHTYRLLYQGTSDSVYRDGHYKTGGVFLKGTTPSWLKIDPFSGVLYGTPPDSAAPHGEPGNCIGPDTVTVIVQDQCQLTAYKQFPLIVDSTNHSPAFLRAPRTLCVTNTVAFCDSVLVRDRDLRRNNCATDTLHIAVVTSPTGQFTVTPNVIPGFKANDTTVLHICGTFTEDQSYFLTDPLAPRYIKLTVTDAAGNTDTISYLIHVGDKPTFECAVTISNVGTSTHAVDMQRLCFGAGRAASDSIDIRYCEYEVPPQPVQSVFDARWELPGGGTTKGTVIDIRRDTNLSDQGVGFTTWQMSFTAGAEGSVNFYPLEICWKPSCLKGVNTKGHFYLRHPKTPSEFSIDMASGTGPIDNSLFTLKPMGTDSMCLEIRDKDLRNALIVFVPFSSGVEAPQPALNQFALEQNYPNPFNPTNSSTTITFNVPKRSDVRIDIYDLKGAIVRSLVKETLDAGQYPVTWDATDASGRQMPSGTYIAKMTAGSFVQSIKMTLNK